MLDNTAVAKQALSLIDLTSLDDNDTDEVITGLCQKAVTSHGEVAAVCVYSRFVKLAKKCLENTQVNIATVVNFPSGDQKLEAVLQETKQAIADGADEIDLVIPYKEYLAGDTETTSQFVSECKKVCGPNITLKVILETGALQQPEIITQASIDAIEAGANFLKTSTGKIAVGATIDAAELMLTAIKQSGKLVGFKASGGIRTVEQASQYLQLAGIIMGQDWVTPKTFRFGASSLLQDVLDNLQLDLPVRSAANVDYQTQAKGSNYASY